MLIFWILLTISNPITHSLPRIHLWSCVCSNSTFYMSSRVGHKTPEEGQSIYRPKRCEHNNKDDVNSPNILSNNNHQASSQKLRQITGNYLQCSPIVPETWVQSQVESYQKFLKWYLIPLCLTLSNVRYVSRIKWSNPEKGVALSPTPRCSSYWKGSLLVTLDYGYQLYLLNCMSRIIFCYYY